MWRASVLVQIGLLIAVPVATAQADIAWAHDDPDNGQWNWSGHSVGSPDTLEVSSDDDAYTSGGSIPLSTTYSYVGDDSIKLHYSHASGGYWSVYLPSDGAGNPPSQSPWNQSGFDVGDEDWLTFYVMGTNGREKFAVRLLDTNGYGSAYREIDDYGTVSGSWQLFKIPVRDLTSGPMLDPNFDVHHVRFVVFCNPSDPIGDETVYVDKIDFVPEPGTALLMLAALVGLLRGRREQRYTSRTTRDGLSDA